MKNFKICDISDVKESFTKLIGERYALVTVSDNEKINMMTASWGSMGIMWNKNIVNVVVRPSRYSYDFLINNEYFSLNFLTEGHDEAYRICGTKSGRESNKIEETGLIPVKFDESVYAFEQSEYMFVCKKLYCQPMAKEFFCDEQFGKSMYPNDDIHTMFIAEVEKVYIKE